MIVISIDREVKTKGRKREIATGHREKGTKLANLWGKA